MAFKICVVCCGGIAFQMHGYAYKKYAALHDDVILSGCCDTDEKKALSFKEKFGFVKAYTDYREMLEAEKPDAVCLNAPVDLTAAMAVEILKRGYPLMLEKPPGKNREETLSIMKAAEESGVLHQVAFNRRFIPVLDLMIRELRERYAAGDILNINCEFFRVSRKDPDFSTTAIHGIDTVRYAAGCDYREIDFMYQDIPGCPEGVSNFFLQGKFVSGAAAQLSFCPFAGVRLERITVVARGGNDEGNSVYKALLPYGDSLDSPGSLLVYRGDRLVKEVKGETLTDSTEIFETNGFYQEDSSFFDAVRRGEQPATNLASAIQSVEIAGCIRRRESRYRL